MQVFLMCDVIENRDLCQDEQFYLKTEVDARIAEIERYGAEYIARTDPILAKMEGLHDRIAKLEELLQFYAGVKAYGWDANGQYHDDLSIPAREALHIGL